MVEGDAAKPQTLTDIGRFTALAVLCCLLVSGIPALSFLTLALCPLPIAIISTRQGIKAGLACLCALGTILILLIGLTNAIPLVLIVGSMGIAYPVGVKKNISFAQSVMVGTAFIFLSLILLGLLTFQTRKINIVDQQIKGLKKDIASFRQDYTDNGFSEEQVAEQFKAINESLKIFPRIVPAAIIMFSLWVSFLYLSLAGLVLRNLGEGTIVFPSFRLWQFPWYFAWGYIIGLIGTLFSSYLGIYQGIGRVVGMNFLVVFNLLFLVQGFAIVYFFLDKFKINNYLRVLGFVLLLIIPLASPLVTWFGLLDVWYNFRKIPSEE